MDPVKISYFTDALCVWAYVSQIRIDELKANFKSSIEVECRYFHVFGDVSSKMDAAWKQRGGLPAYRQHVREVVEKFGHVQLHERTWQTDVPKSSMPAHLWLCAIRHVEIGSRCAPGSSDRAAWAFRDAFFRHGRDISQAKVLLDTVEFDWIACCRDQGCHCNRCRPRGSGRRSRARARSVDRSEPNASLQRRTAAPYGQRRLPDHRGKHPRVAGGFTGPTVLVLAPPRRKRILFRGQRSPVSQPLA